MQEIQEFCNMETTPEIDYEPRPRIKNRAVVEKRGVLVCIGSQPASTPRHVFTWAGTGSLTSPFIRGMSLATKKLK
jgi:hypothetical protein